MGELDASQVQRLLEDHHLARLTCHGAGGATSIPVRYSMSDGNHICVQDAPCCAALARMNTSVRLEVDDSSGPTSWSTVIGWGFVEGSEGPCAGVGTYSIRLTAVRGFYHAGTRAAD